MPKRDASDNGFAPVRQETNAKYPLSVRRRVLIAHRLPLAVHGQCRLTRAVLNNVF